MSSDSKPTGLIASKGIELLTFPTPNGIKISILLEELKETYGMDYTVQPINIAEGVQKEAWYTKLNPNGRIPTLVDHDRNSLAIMEGAAILQYLSRNYDSEKKFTFTDEEDFTRVEQWVCWLQSGLAPMQGQANVFYRMAKERIAFPTQRYVGETERLVGVLDKQLEGRDYLVGPGKGKYSIADIANWSWASHLLMAGVEPKDFPNLNKWLDRIAERPAVQKGAAVPFAVKYNNGAYRKRMEEEEGFPEAEKKLAEELKNAKEQYNYVYKSP